MRFALLCGHSRGCDAEGGKTDVTCAPGAGAQQRRGPGQCSSGQGQRLSRGDWGQRAADWQGRGGAKGRKGRSTLCARSTVQLYVPFSVGAVARCKRWQEDGLLFTWQSLVHRFPAGT